MKRNRVLLCAAAVLAGVVLAGSTCNVPPPGQGNGTLRVMVTDKPFPFDWIQSAVVTLTRVSVHKVADATQNATSQPADDSGEKPANVPGGDNHQPGAGNGQHNPETAEEQAATQPADDEQTDDASAGEWITVFEDSTGKPFDLVDLRNGRTNLLANADLPAGTYNQMRLVVSGGEVTLTDGRKFPLKVPSGQESGIKLHFTFEVTDGQPTELLLDVDLSRAFQPIPGGKINSPDGIRQFHFQPSLAMRLIKIVEAGSISGKVTDSDGNPIEKASVTAYKNDAEVTSTQTEADGTYKLVGLTTGTYKVTFSATGFADAEVDGVEVTAGQDTPDVNVTLTAAL